MSASHRERERYLRDHGWRLIGGEHDVPDLGVCWWIEPAGMLPAVSAWLSVRDWQVHWHGGPSETWQQFCAWLTAPPAAPKLVARRLFDWAE